MILRHRGVQNRTRRQDIIQAACVLLPLAELHVFKVTLQFEVATLIRQEVLVLLQLMDVFAVSNVLPAHLNRFCERRKGIRHDFVQVCKRPMLKDVLRRRKVWRQENKMPKMRCCDCRTLPAKRSSIFEFWYVRLCRPAWVFYRSKRGIVWTFYIGPDPTLCHV